MKESSFSNGKSSPEPALLERRLIACANLVPGVRSLYRWQGEVADEAEGLEQLGPRGDGPEGGPEPQIGGEGVLSPAEIWNLVDFIQQLPSEPARMPKRPDLALERERLSNLSPRPFARTSSHR